MGIRLLILLMILTGCSSPASNRRAEQRLIFDQQIFTNYLLLEEKKLDIMKDVYLAYLNKPKEKHVEMKVSPDGQITGMTVFTQDNYNTDPRVIPIADMMGRMKPMPALPEDESKWSWKQLYSAVKPLMYLVPIGDALKYFWGKAYK